VATTGRRATAGDHTIRDDLSDPGSWPELIDWWSELMWAERWDRVDLIHAAGTLTPIGPAAGVDPAAYRSNVLLNSAAPQVLGAGFLRIANRLRIRGSLVLISSGAARAAYEGWSSYGAGKAAADQWVRSVGAEQDRLDVPVKVLSIAPGVVATAMQEEIRRTPATAFPKVQRFEELYRAAQLADPDDVAVRLWLVVEDDAVPNGTVIDLRDR
jgi:NAD(P)-dependent dehydrogenase (short-subunit alcohol dehydrogenase family)